MKWRVYFCGDKTSFTQQLTESSRRKVDDIIETIPLL